MSYGIISERKTIQPNYKLWGLDGNIAIQKQNQIDPIILNSIEELINLEDYQLSYAYIVDYYQGANLEVIKALWLRFSRKDGKLNELNGEHFSAIFNLSNMQLLGLTKMQASENNSNWLTYQEALAKAVSFLQKYASDLIGPNVEIPLLNKVDITNKIAFNPSIRLDHVELNWMDIYAGKIIIDNQPTQVMGIKVKFYIPQTKLWSWVIVSQNGEIITFERNISWDFDKMQRQTQMWLHDGWLDCQNIKL